MQNNKKKVNNAIVVVKYLVFLSLIIILEESTKGVLLCYPLFPYPYLLDIYHVTLYNSFGALFKT